MTSTLCQGVRATYSMSNCNARWLVWHCVRAIGGHASDWVGEGGDIAAGIAQLGAGGEGHGSSEAQKPLDSSHRRQVGELPGGDVGLKFDEAHVHRGVKSLDVVLCVAPV